jgi:hypothetical protein
MGDFLIKGCYGTMRAFFDQIDGIEYNPNTNQTNIQISNNSITVNALARKAHQAILDPQVIKKKAKKYFQEKTEKAAERKDDREKQILENSEFIGLLLGDYMGKLNGKVERIIDETKVSWCFIN